MPHTEPTLCLLVHGFKVSDDGLGTVARLEPYLSSMGIPSIVFRTGFLNLMDVRLFNRSHAKRLAQAAHNAKLLNQRVVAIGHSNGCALLHQATTEFDAPIDYLIYINPALDPELAPGPAVSQLDVWHSPSDPWVRLSRLLPMHPWGEMGAIGYQGSDPRVTNFDKEHMPVVSDEHSDFAQAEVLAYFAPLITNRISRHELLHREAAADSLSNGPGTGL